MNTHYPCYFEAAAMGLWNKDNPTEVKVRHEIPNPAPARNRDGVAQTYIAPRKLVAAELAALLKQAAKQYPKLADKADYIIYGPAKKPYAAYDDAEFMKYRGREWEWQGLLGQKIPRFDNRIISKCCLIPRLNVCNAIEPLAQDVIFLMSLKNMRYSFGSKTTCALTPEQLKDLYKRFKGNISRKGDTSVKKVITSAAWKKYIKEELNAEPNSTQTEIEQPDKGGRARFCRPALKIMKDLLLSGKNPHDYYAEKTAALANTDPTKGLVKADYSFLLAMPSEWQLIHIPDHREEEKNLSQTDKNRKIERIINSVNSPIVRHRLKFFTARMQKLAEQFGAPERLVLEVARDEFMGEEKKKDYDLKMKKNRKEIELAKAEANGEDLLKMRLLREQKFQDPYDTSENPKLEKTALADYEVDHIVPRALGGSDAFVNKVLTKHSLNMDKRGRTPYQWLHADEDKWAVYKRRIKDLDLSKKKTELLLADNAQEIEQNRNDLQATAHMEKLAMRIACLQFGWGNQTKGDTRHIYAVNGGQTYKVRKQFKLNRLLHSDLNKTEFDELVKAGKLDEKDRSNPKHHALDALVISVVPEVRYDKEKDADIAPEFFTREFCRNAIGEVAPRNVRFEKPVLRETILGLRKIVSKDKKGRPVTQYCLVSRFGAGTKIEDFKDIETAKKYVLKDKVFSPQISRDFAAELNRNPTPEQWRKFVENYQGGRIKKIKLKTSALVDEADVKYAELNGRRIVESVADHKNISKMPGQFYVDKKEHLGQIVYQKAKDKWTAEPVYVFESVYEKLAAAREKYGEVYFFRSQMLVATTGTMKKKDETYLPCIYRLTTLKGNGEVKLEFVNGQNEFSVSLNTAMNEGKMRPAQKEI